MDGGGVPGLRFSGRLIQPWTGGGSQVSDFWVGSSSLGGGGGGGVPVSVKGKIFDTRFGLIHVQTGKKFLSRDPPSLVKGKFFDTRFGLIHVQTGKKIFCQGTPPPLLEKGKYFDTRFGLIHVQTGKKNFCQGTPHPPGIARNCYGHTAGGMPLAFTQEDFLVS